MSTTFRQIAEQAHRKLSGGDVPQDSKWDIRELTLYARQCLGDVIKGGWYKDLVFEQRTPDEQFVIRYANVPVSSTGYNGQKFSILPSSYVSLPFRMGINQVRPDQDTTVEFIPVGTNFESTFSGLEASNLNGNVGYYPEGNNIFYTSNISLAGKEYTSVTIKLFGGYEGITDLTPINIPVEMQRVMVDMIFDKFSPEIGIAHSQVPDLNPNTTD